MKYNFLFTIFTALIFSCSSDPPQDEVVVEAVTNPAAPDFDTLNSDAKAIAIADEYCK